MLRPVGARLLDVDRSSAMPCVGVSEEIGRDHAVDEGGRAATLAALLDPCLKSPVLGVWGDLPQCRLPIVHPDLTPDLCPVLLDASALHGNRQQLFAQDIAEAAQAEVRCLQDGTARTRSICALCFAGRPVRMSELAARMASAAVVTDTKGAKRLFRYWDPRVAWHLFRPASPIRWEDVVSTQGLTWWAIDIQGKPFRSSVDDVPSSGTRRLTTLSVEQERWLHQVSCFNAAWQSAAALGWNSPKSVLELEPVLHECFQAGQALRLEADDLASFAARRLALGVPIEHSVLLRSRLAETCVVGLGFSELQAQLDDEEWQRIADEARAARTRNGDFAYD